MVRRRWRPGREGLLVSLVEAVGLLCCLSEGLRFICEGARCGSWIRVDSVRVGLGFVGDKMVTLSFLSTSSFCLVSAVPWELLDSCTVGSFPGPPFVEEEKNAMLKVTFNGLTDFEKRLSNVDLREEQLLQLSLQNQEQQPYRPITYIYTPFRKVGTISPLSQLAGLKTGCS